MKKLGILTLSAVMGLALAPTSALADPIVGSVGFGGEFVPTPGPGLDGTTTGLDFKNPALVTAGDGDYAGTFGSQVTFTDFTFDPFGGSVSPLWTFMSGGKTFSFDLESVAIEDRASNFLFLSGTGTLHIDGKDDTAGTWSFSADHASNSGVFTFSSNSGVPGGEGEGAVPEPASLLLLGLGMTGVASRIARRRK
jgi:hypothetical protein